MTSPLAGLPLVGRTAELGELRASLATAGGGAGHVVFISGEGGVGKTRLAQSIVEEARAGEWRIAVGRGFAAETGVPYSLFADALLPVLDDLGGAARAIITRGADEELMQIFPGLAPPGQRVVPAADLPDLKNRLLWNFTQVLRSLARQKPLLILLEDLHWADASSLELLHFVARQTSAERILLLGTFNETLRDRNPGLAGTVESLESLARARLIRLAPLNLSETGDVVTRAFGVSAARARDFIALLYGWTRGNPFFITEILHSFEGSGPDWNTETIELPASIRDAVMQRARRLSPEAFKLAQTLAAFGRQTRYEALSSVAGGPVADVLAALGELVQSQLVNERPQRATIVYDFHHPLTREALLNDMGETRRAALHARIAHALQAWYGDAAADHADELAFHFSRSPGLDERALKYLRIAGERAFATFANREAVGYLSAALERTTDDDGDRVALMETLARAHQRLGHYEQATALWQQVRSAAEAAADHARVAAVERRMGVACFWTGRPERALEHYERGLEAAGRADDATQQVHIRIARAMCLQEMGRLDQALPDARQALELAEQQPDDELRGRVHRALLLLHVWNGPPDQARRHGRAAVELLAGSRDRALTFSAHWAIAVLEGLTGNSRGMLEHLAEAESIGIEMRSPVLRLWTDELAIEYGYGAGDWGAAIERGTRAIEMARALNQRTLLPRLLVWTSLMHIGRDEMDVARAYIDEAWQLAGAGTVHVVVPAHTGRASYHLALGEYDEAIRIGMKGLAIAESSGYAVWAVHRLLPVLAEAQLYKRNVAAAADLGTRLRREAVRLSHSLGLAWADTCDALVTWLNGDAETGAARLAAAAEALERIPYVPDAARVRRQLAGRLADIGDRDGALRELRRVHETFSLLGAERELIKTREMFRELGARPPAREQRAGVEALTAREAEIVRLLLAGKSNKAIGKALGISDRTVSTHLSHVFRKLDVHSRSDLIRRREHIELPAVPRIS